MELIDEMKEQGYSNLRVLPDGTIIGTLELMFTRAIFIGLNRSGWDKRFCYKDKMLAISELAKLVDQDSEPTGWVARRGD